MGYNHGCKERNAQCLGQTASLVGVTPHQVLLRGVLYISVNTDIVIFVFPPD